MSIRHHLGKFVALSCGMVAVAATALAQNPAATINVNANANRRAISPLIYGANWADKAMITNLNLAINRRGGNATTTYNWQNNAANRAGDWYFESLGDSDGSAPSAAADAFINATKAGGAESMITIPLVDWLAKLGPNRSGRAGYSIAKYGPQTGSDPWWPDAGNGIGTNAANQTSWIIRTNDPNDAYTPNSTTIQQQWVQHLTNKFGTSSSSGVKYYLMDNEHGVWPWNHRPIMPTGQTMDQIRDRILAYAGAVKAVDPNALIVGPEEWGWPNYFRSPYDTYSGGDTDRNAHGGWDYMPWLLNQFKLTNNATGQRLLDVFSLHYYPQYSEFSQGDSSTAAQLKRNECTRDLWDTSYVSSSWIGASVQLIPRMKSWVNTYYPGTKLAITEYSWGAESHISGAIAQADVLGIFGRDGVDIATFWGSLDSSDPIYKTFKLYRNYDGNKSTFGDTSVAATVANPNNVAAFAAQRTNDNALTVMVLNKYLSNNTPITVNIANFPIGGAAQVWQFTSANTINRLADTGVTNGGISFSAPAQSITLFVVQATNAPPAAPSGVVASSASAQVTLTWSATIGADSYIVKRSTTSGSGYTILTSGLTATNYLDNAVVNGTTYYYVVAATNNFGLSADSSQVSATPSDTKALYAFEGNAQDGSGSGNHGTATAVNYVAGKVGSQAGQFNGTSSYVSIPRSVQDDFTVAMWVKTTDTAGGAGAQWWSGKGLVDGEVGGGGADWGTAIVNGKFVLGVGSTGGDTTLASTVNINDGTWHHVAATRNNSSGAIAVYVDGILRGSGTGPTGSRTFPPSLRIGSLQTGNNFLNGTLDDVRLYDRILTVGEIAALIGTPPAAPIGLAATAGDGNVALSWNASATATNYYVKRSTTSGSGYTSIATNASLTFTNTGLSNGTLYYFVVSAVNASGESPNSAQISARPTASAPPELSFVTVGNQLQLNWPADHTGWLLQSQTNSLAIGLGTNWSTGSSSAQTNQMTVPMSTTHGAVFFRLVRP